MTWKQTYRACILMAIGTAYGCFIMSIDSYYILIPVGLFTGISFYTFSSLWIKE